MRSIRVVVVDDSSYSRRTIGKMLEDMPNVEVVGYAADGEEGLRRIIDLKPDLVTLDLIMPRMDGFTLLRIIMNTHPVPVIVISSRNEDSRVFQALELGALDFVAKPTPTISEELLSIREDLQNKVRSIISLNLARIFTADHRAPVPSRADILAPRHHFSTEIQVVAIGASTGGPRALQTIFADLPASPPFAIVVSQHMPPGFTRAFADRLDRGSSFTVKEAEDGDPVRPGSALIAPGGCNLLFEKRGGEVVVSLKAPRPEHRYYPSVDAMFTSLSALFGPRMLAVVLTGMGNDGSAGVRAVKSAGGVVLAESEESAVVFGMPREAAATGLVDRIVTLGQMGDEILRMASRTEDGST
ncbi:chemotaxis response regulator protein-glutamate methylesterase [Geobacter sp. DSM 9736]|uniref:protein-glutamate methylesterase/protein-glutamine glutaminase n=1 Tax=Geobacter sp. DSM 9736 TaxID=1277350 RepID=UPI000B5064F6|nr:chemotaxis response regulator protein-glutamate methylesterase [Geobacter sp. DSM 9736]SNB45095.1 two-component system, chemotaxis family, response regulator CheB [Geobacter sp. DSM 9736]